MVTKEDLLANAGEFTPAPEGVKASRPMSETFVQRLGTHRHYLVWAYDSKDPVSGQCTNVVSFDFVAEDYGEALKQARLEYQPEGRNSGYILRSVVEHINGQCTNGGAH